MTAATKPIAHSFMISEEELRRADPAAGTSLQREPGRDAPDAHSRLSRARERRTVLLRGLLDKFQHMRVCE